MPPMPAATTPVTAAATTPAVNAAVAAAKDLPGLVAALQTASPQLAQQIEGKPLALSKSMYGNILLPVVTYLAGRYGLGWDESTCALVTGFVLAACAVGFRLITTSPISGLLTKGTVKP